MNRRNNSKTSLFLMELIIAILFFSLASAVCVRLFTSAHLISDKSINLSNAVMWSQNLSEAFWGVKGDAVELSKLYPQGVLSHDPDTETDTLILFFNDNWDISKGDGLVDASYEAIIEITKEAASTTYSDVSEYNMELSGDAMVGKVAVIDLRNTTEVFSSIPEDKERIIHYGSIDTYIGEEER